MPPSLPVASAITTSEKPPSAQRSFLSSILSSVASLFLSPLLARSSALSPSSSSSLLGRERGLKHSSSLRSLLSPSTDSESESLRAELAMVKNQLAKALYDNASLQRDIQRLQTANVTQQLRKGSLKDQDDSDDDEKPEGKQPDSKNNQKSTHPQTTSHNINSSNSNNSSSAFDNSVKSKKARIKRAKSEATTQDAKLLLSGWSAAPREVLGIVFEMLGSQQAYVLDIVCRKWTRAVRKTMDSVNRWIQQRLTFDLQDMTNALDKMVKERRPWQMAIINATRVSISSLWPGARVEVYGSFATGLSGPSSDIDLVVCGVKEHYEQLLTNSVPIGFALRTLTDHLQRESWVQTVELVESTAVPVIKIKAAFAELGSSVNMDLSFDAPSHRGLSTCAFVKGLVAEFPALQALAVVLKQFLVMKGLNSPYSGGLSSYGLVLLLTSDMQKGRLPGSTKASTLRWFNAASPQDKNLYLGSAFLSFLDMFGRRFSPKVHAVSVREAGGEIARNSLGAVFTSHPLVLVDPFDPSNNVGRACFGVSQVQHAISEALKTIEGVFYRRMGSSPPKPILGGVFGTSHHNNVVAFARQLWLPQPKQPIYNNTGPASMTKFKRSNARAKVQWFSEQKKATTTQETPSHQSPLPHRPSQPNRLTISDDEAPSEEEEVEQVNWSRLGLPSLTSVVIHNEIVKQTVGPLLSFDCLPPLVEPFSKALPLLIEKSDVDGMLSYLDSSLPETAEAVEIKDSSTRFSLAVWTECVIRAITLAVVKQQANIPSCSALEKELSKKVRDLNSQLLALSMECSRTLLNSTEVIQYSSARYVLNQLGKWIGELTLARNRALKAKDCDLKMLLITGYREKRLIAAIPFVCAVLKATAQSKVFKPPNPWIVSMLSLLVELCNRPSTQSGLRYEVEILLQERLRVQPSDVRSITSDVRELLDAAQPESRETQVALVRYGSSTSYVKVDIPVSAEKKVDGKSKKEVKKKDKTAKKEAQAAKKEAKALQRVASLEHVAKEETKLHSNIIPVTSTKPIKKGSLTAQEEAAAVAVAEVLAASSPRMAPAVSRSIIPALASTPTTKLPTS